MLAAALDIFSRDGAAFLERWGHVLFGITWIGILYYFNVVQVPAFAEMEAAARNNAIDKLASRALWWFRWAAAATFATGLLLLLTQKFGDDPELFSGDYFKSPGGIAIAAGVLLAITMFLNVWLVIWPNQKIVIANARNVAAGGEADPGAAAAGRKGLLASRQNTIFSLPMLIFMVGAAHFPVDSSSIDVSGGHRGLFWAIWGVLWLAMEANALGYLGGTAPGGARAIYDKHQNAIVVGIVYAIIAIALYSLALSS